MNMEIRTKENDYIIFDDVITPNHYIGRKMIIWYQSREIGDLR